MAGRERFTLPADAVILYAAGKSCRQIADRYRMHEKTVRRCLNEMGVEIARGRPVWKPPDNIMELVKQHGVGGTAKMFGVCAETVIKYYKHNGRSKWVMKPRRRNKKPGG